MTTLKRPNIYKKKLQQLKCNLTVILKTAAGSKFCPFLICLVLCHISFAPLFVSSYLYGFSPMDK